MLPATDYFSFMLLMMLFTFLFDYAFVALMYYYTSRYYFASFSADVIAFSMPDFIADGCRRAGYAMLRAALCVFARYALCQADMRARCC